MADSFDGEAVARQRIAEEAEAQTGFLDLSELGLSGLPPELFGLRHLRRLHLGLGLAELEDDWIIVEWDRAPNRVATQLGKLAVLRELEALSVSNTDCTDIDFVTFLPSLKWIDCRATSITDLRPLATITGLRWLNCSFTKMADLGPLADMQALQSLNCAITKVADLGPLKGLTSLQSLICHTTPIDDLSPLASAITLRSLTCTATRVRDLSPLTHLMQLKSLDCSMTQIADLSPVAGLVELQSLDCGSTRVADLRPLTNLTKLEFLDCGRTLVTDLSPLLGLPVLQRVNCSWCHLSSAQDGIWLKPSMVELLLYKSDVSGIPSEVLSQEIEENCLAAVRAHIHDLVAGFAAATDVKLIVLGNGRVGKTQICRRLRHEPYDDSQASTHGIQVTSARLDTGDADPTRLNIWDFGGQDLYHGTHALFLRTRAVFLLVWARETEDEAEHSSGGMIFRNQRLPYWLAYVRHLGGADSPVLLVQTRCDRPQDEALAPPIPDDADRPAHCVALHYSALNDRGREGLDRALREAIGHLRATQGVAQIGIGRMRVQRALQDLRDADAAVPPDQRQYRTVTQAHFRQMCAEAGNVSSPALLLDYLHNAGIVFYRPGLFRDSIVLDQGWALDAIYAVFNREKSYRELKRLGGRFTRPLLELLVWGDHSADEQRLFLDMMLSCGVCFVHRDGPDDDRDATEYIAPDLLPERAAVQDVLDGRWNTALPTETEEFRYEMLHPGLVRGIIGGIGSIAGVDALYWRGGVCAYEARTHSHLLIEQDMTDGWHGRLRVQTQGGQAAVLLARVCEWIARRTDRDGLRAERLNPLTSRGSSSPLPSPSLRPWFASRPKPARGGGIW